MKAALFSFLLLASTASAAEFYVAPQGNDANPGTAAQPFATLQRARDGVRQLKAKGPLAEAVTVRVADGEYAIPEPLSLTVEDSGTAAAPVRYEAMPGARPVFTGGRKLSGWQDAGGGVWKTEIPEVAAGHWYFEQLFVGGQRAVRARTPNKFFYYIQDLAQEMLTPAAGKKRGEARQTIQMRKDDYRAALEGVSEAELRDVNLVVYHNWDNTRRFLDGADAEHAKITTTGEALKPWNPWQRNSHFLLENYRKALDMPGEWFLSRQGTLYYMPRPGEDMRTISVVAPVAAKFLVIQGDPAQGKFVEHVSFKGLCFEHSQWVTPPGGFEPTQAAATIDAVVQADGARNVILEDCAIGHVGTYCVWFRKGCQDCAVRRCHLYDFGAGAVRIGEMGIAGKEDERTGKIEIDNNIMRHGGRIFPCAVGVWVGQSGDNRITHNEIADLFYSGISTGWTWGYGQCLAKRNTIEFNNVHHLGWGVLSDMGGIYTLGPSEGSVVRNNVFHDIYAYSYGGWGLYTDEGSTGILFENNLVYRVKTGGFHQHYGKENIVRNNILAFSKLHQLQATRVEEHLSFNFENNIVYYDTGDLLNGPWDRVKFVSGKNVYYNAAQSPVQFQGNTLEQWQAKGHEQGSIVADPKLAAPQQNDFRVDDDSPAVKLGFKPFDSSKAGVYGDEAWVKKAKDATYPPLEVVPEPPPAEIHDGYEAGAVGQSPAGLEAHVENRGDAIIVTDETAASGTKCLKIVDAPGLQNAYNPHLVYGKVTYGDVKACNAFDLRIEPGSHVHFEWRDYSGSGYKTGPNFLIQGGRLQGPSGTTLELPSRQWIHFEVEQTLGAEDKGRWTLKVTLPGQQPKLFADLPVAVKEFKRLTWVGFTSLATDKTWYYLDNFELVPK